MKIGCFLLWGSLFLSSPLFASSYPHSYISNALSKAIVGENLNSDELAVGEVAFVDFANHQVMIYKRTPEDIEAIERAERTLFADPDDANFYVQLKNIYRSTISLSDVLLFQSGHSISALPYRSAERGLLVTQAAAPVTGCLLKLLPKEHRSSVEVFVDPCSGGRYDAAGRALVGELKMALQPSQPAKLNLSVFPHEQISRESLNLGFIAGKIPETPRLDFADCYKNSDPNEMLLGAASFNDEEYVLKALNSGAQPSYGSLQNNPLNAAIIGASTGVVEILLAHGAKPDFQSGILARLLGRNDVMKLLDNY